MRGTDAATAPTLKSGGERDGQREGQSGIAGDTVPIVANTLKGQRGKGGGGIGPEETLLPQATVEETGALQASQKGYRNDADSAGGGMYAVTGDPTLGQPEAGSLGRMGETGGHRLDLDGHGAYVASREDPTALDTRMSHGPDDNRAQAGHLVHNEELSKALSKGKRNDPSVESYVTHTLRSEGHDASEDGTGRGTPLVAGTLTSGQGPQRLDDNNVGGNHVVAVGSGEAREVDVAPAVAGGNPTDARNAGRSGTQFTAIVSGQQEGPDTPQTVSNDSSPVTADNEVGALKVGSGLGIPSAPAVFTKVRNASSADDDESWSEGETARTLNEMDGDRTTLAAARSLVRRLSPTECERLQGVPDGWTLPYGPSLADAPSWYELGQPAPVNHRTFNALPDQKRRDNGEMKGAVELRETDRSLTLDTSGRDPSAFNGGMMVVPEDDVEVKAVTDNGEMVYESDQAGSLTTGGGKPGQGQPVVHCFHSDAERGGEAKADSPDAEGRMRKRDPGVGIAEDEAYSLTTGKPHAVGYSVSGGGGDEADLRAEETESAETLTTRGAWAGTQGGTLVDQQADHLDSLGNEVRELTPGEDMGEAMRVYDPDGVAPRARKQPPLVQTDEPIAFKTDGDERSSVSAGSTAPTVRGAEAGTTAVAFKPMQGADAHTLGESETETPTLAAQSGGNQVPAVAFTQNQREELRELDAAGSLSGQGTHQTTYVATEAVAQGAACPFDCPPDGPRYASLGDAVTAPVAQWIGERLIDVLRERGVIDAEGNVDLTADLAD